MANEVAIRLRQPLLLVLGPGSGQIPQPSGPRTVRVGGGGGSGRGGGGRGRRGRRGGRGWPR
jgi:hypothetical protein